MPGGQEVLIVVVVIALIFGASRLPTLARNMGLGIKEFRKGIREAREDEAEHKSGDTGGDTGGTAAPSSNGTGAGDDVPAKRRD